MNVQDEDDFVFVCLFGAYVQSLLQRSWGQMDPISVERATRRRKRRRPRTMWVRAWLSEERREQLGHYSNFITRELRNEDVNAFRNYLRIPPELFDEILEKIAPAIEKQDTKFRSRPVWVFYIVYDRNAP